MCDFIIENRILVRYTGKSKEVVVPKGITIIGNKAFAGQDIIKFIIPEGVTTIGDHAFYECANLTEVSQSIGKIECSFTFNNVDLGYYTLYNS